MWIIEAENIGFECEGGERERMSSCIERTRDQRPRGPDKMQMVSALVLHDIPVTDFCPQLNFFPWVIRNAPVPQDSHFT